MNLFANPDWTGGHYTLTDARGNVLDNKRVPNNWKVWYADSSIAKLPGQDDDWIEPELEIKDKNSIHVSEISTLLQGRPDRKLYAAYKGWGRVWLKLFQTIALTPGKHRLRFQLWPNILAKQEIIDNVMTNTPAPDPLNAEAALYIGSQATDFIDGIATPFAKWNSLAAEFNVITPGNYDCGITVRARWGVPVVGWFFGLAECERVDAEPAPNTPPTTDQAPPTETLSQYQTLKLQLELMENDLRRARFTLQSLRDSYNLQ